MSRTRRAWWWAGGAWLALVLAGGGATLALRPDSPSPDGETREGQPSGAPALSPEQAENCEEAMVEARREVEREPRDGLHIYAYKCGD
ncbi:hypothetical protein ACWGJ2_02780 [Streptomyces sp. NPDC054796]